MHQACIIFCWPTCSLYIRFPSSANLYIYIYEEKEKCWWCIGIWAQCSVISLDYNHKLIMITLRNQKGKNDYDCLIILQFSSFIIILVTWQPCACCLLLNTIDWKMFSLSKLFLLKVNDKTKIFPTAEE